MPDGSALAKLIRDQRKAIGLDQQGLAERLNVKRETVSKMERGLMVYPLTPETTHDLSRHLGLSVFDLVRAMGYQVEMPGFVDEQEVALVEAYRRLTPAQQQVLRAAAGLPSPRALGLPEGEPLRRQMASPQR